MRTHKSPRQTCDNFRVCVLRDNLMTLMPAIGAFSATTTFRTRLISSRRRFQSRTLDCHDSSFAHSPLPSMKVSLHFLCFSFSFFLGVIAQRQEGLIYASNLSSKFSSKSPSKVVVNSRG